MIVLTLKICRSIIPNQRINVLGQGWQSSDLSMIRHLNGESQPTLPWTILIIILAPAMKSNGLNTMTENEIQINTWSSFMTLLFSFFFFFYLFFFFVNRIEESAKWRWPSQVLFSKKKRKKKKRGPLAPNSEVVNLSLINRINNCTASASDKKVMRLVV